MFDDFKRTPIVYFISKPILKCTFTSSYFKQKNKKMKKLSLITFAFSAFLLASCGSQNTSTAGNTSNTSNAATNATTTSAGSDYGTMTCVIDGKPDSIKVENTFFEMNLDVDSKGPKDGIELLDGSAKKEGFQFEIKNTGTTKITNGINGCILSYYNPAGKVYSADNALVTITSFNGGHLTGTFAGGFAAYEGDSKIQITDGKFDLR